MYGKRSGLMATTADWWIFDTKSEFIFITPQALKDLIIETNPPLRQFVGKGDMHPKKAYLIKIETIKKYAKTSVLRPSKLQKRTTEYNASN